jgi:cysteine sulfinate desulfinase/cysteine desulfurase-like protein
MEKLGNAVRNIQANFVTKEPVFFFDNAFNSYFFLILNTAVSFKIHKSIKPCLITTRAHCPKFVEAASMLAKMGIISVMYIKPGIDGSFVPSSIKTLINENTCLISFSHANPDVGTLLNLQEMGQIAHERQIPTHIDLSYSFANSPFALDANNVDILTMDLQIPLKTAMSFAIVNRDFIKGYKVDLACFSLIRDLTMDTINRIVSAVEMFEEYQKKRRASIKAIGSKKKHFIDILTKKFPLLPEPETDENYGLYIIGNNTNTVPDILALSFLKKKGNAFSNVLLYRHMDKYKPYISLGSYPVDKYNGTSDIINALDIPSAIKKGTIVVRFSEQLSKDQLNKMAECYIKGVEGQLADVSI